MLIFQSTIIPAAAAAAFEECKSHMDASPDETLSITISHVNAEESCESYRVIFHDGTLIQSRWMGNGGQGMVLARKGHTCVESRVNIATEESMEEATRRAVEALQAELDKLANEG